MKPSARPRGKQIITPRHLLLADDFNADGERDVLARCVDAKELVVMMGQ